MVSGLPCGEVLCGAIDGLLHWIDGTRDLPNYFWRSWSPVGMVCNLQEATLLPGVDYPLQAALAVRYRWSWIVGFHLMWLGLEVIRAMRRTYFPGQPIYLEADFEHDE